MAAKIEQATYEVGIERIAFYTTSYVLPLSTLAVERGYQADHYWQQLKQDKMAILPPSEDWVTLAANALERMLAGGVDDDGSAIEALDCCDEVAAIDDPRIIARSQDFAQKRQHWRQQLARVGLVIFATESAREMSKSSASYLHHWFHLPERCRIIELKQACYAGTAGLQLALDYLRQNPGKQAILVASDVAEYQAKTAAESSQGCGAVAMLLAHNPRILSIEAGGAYCSKHSWDFWHPNYLSHALVNGKLSCEIYLKLLERCWQQMAVDGDGGGDGERVCDDVKVGDDGHNGLTLSPHRWGDCAYFCYHSPVPKLVYMAHRRAAKMHGVSLSADELTEALQPVLHYAQQVGNCYTASLYLNLLSLWENQPALQAGDRVALYSYGSGSIGELFFGRFNCTFSEARRSVNNCVSRETLSSMKPQAAEMAGSALKTAAVMAPFEHDRLQTQLDRRVILTWQTYQKWLTELCARETGDWQLTDGSGGSDGAGSGDSGSSAQWLGGNFRLRAIRDGRREYSYGDDMILA